MANKRYNKQVPGYKKGGKAKMMGGGVKRAKTLMMKRPMMKDGGKLKMVKNKEGKMVPFYAADGVGKMKKGGMAKLNPGLRQFLTKKKRGKKNG